MTSLVWFITGCSSGLGASLALTALKAGHKVIATSREPSKTPELVSQVKNLGGKWLALDVCGPNVKQVVEEAMSVNGHIDVLVNNAGVSMFGAVEDVSEAEARTTMDINFFAPLNLIRLVLPSMRVRKTGTIVNITSSAGLVVVPGVGLYAASKHALEGMSESLAQELESFGIRVQLFEPGSFRTSFLDNVRTAKVSEAYLDNPAGKVVALLPKLQATQLGDTEKGAQAIFDVVTETGVAKELGKTYLRVPLGSDCVNRFQGKLDALQESLIALKPVWSSTDFVKKDTVVYDNVK